MASPYIRALRKILRRRIRDIVTVHLVDSVVVVVITSDYVWRYTCPILYCNIPVTLSAKATADLIFSEYRKAILNKHFY